MGGSSSFNASSRVSRVLSVAFGAGGFSVFVRQDEGDCFVDRS
jgi:hypothetical protein